MIRSNNCHIGVLGVLGVLGVATTLSACRAKSGAHSRTQQTSSVAAVVPANLERFGEPVGAGDGVPISQVLREPERFAQKSVIAEGVVHRACSVKGCWMELADTTDADAPRCRVTFKDYGFFVPKDSPGAAARVEGEVVTKVVNASMVKHLEAEGARFSAKQPDGSAIEVRLVASGVELAR